MPETTTKTAARIRQEFIEFFQSRHGHTFVPSSPVVPHDDPTLLFTNAGMNQFKDVFLGHSQRDYFRAANTQKCIRAGGKHNDLDDVGTDLYHHTFFEMLGNWSFGDYFKAEAIEWAWELLVNVWGMESDRIYATVFAGEESEGTEPDEEAEQLWQRYLPPERISRWGKKDNFWEMGNVGPCGPCSEIHYDGRSDEERAAIPAANLINRDHPDVIEIWNLVFIQFNRDAQGKLSPLPAKHVDTGMGFERVVRVLQGKKSNYDIDIWLPVFMAIESHTGAHPYQGHLEDKVDIAYRIIADHVRCLTVAITDGCRPSNEGRGYVLRRILRRAVRVAHQTLQVRGPLLHLLVPAVVDSLGDVFPELKKSPDRIREIIRQEEENFLKTLDRGITYFLAAINNTLVKSDDKLNQDYFREKYDSDGSYTGQWPGTDSVGFFIQDPDPDPDSGSRAVDNCKLCDIDANWMNTRYTQAPQITAADAFQLHDTYGFPIDLTRIMAEERGMGVDEQGFKKLMLHAREISRRTTETDGQIILTDQAVAHLRQHDIQPTEDIDKYHGRSIIARVETIWDGVAFDDKAEPGHPVGLILNHTNHYAEQGGQVGDRGMIIADHDSDETTGRFTIDNTQVFGGYIVHLGQVTEGIIRIGDRVTLKIDQKYRRPIRSNHTATHLLNLALRDVLGDEVEQKGSLVADDRLRFDFTCSHAMLPSEIAEVERRVNQDIADDLAVHSDIVPLAQAGQINGVRAVFGEKYPDPVRVVSIGQPVSELLAEPEKVEWLNYSIEFCGGTHLESTQQIAYFVITQETALAAGVRRITAITGQAAQQAEEAGQKVEAKVIDAQQLTDRQLLPVVEQLNQMVDTTPLGAVTRHRILTHLRPLQDRVKNLEKQARAAATATVVEQARVLADQSHGEVIVSCLLGADKDTLRAAMDVVRAKQPAAAIMLFAGDEIEQKVSIIANVPKPLIQRGLKAGDWVKQAAEICGGSGGGRPDNAQAGGKKPEMISKAIEQAEQHAKTLMG